MRYIKSNDGFVHAKSCGVGGAPFHTFPERQGCFLCGGSSTRLGSPQGVVTCPDCIAIIKGLREAKIEGEPKPQENEEILREAADNWLEYLKISYGKHPKFAREIKEIEAAIEFSKAKINGVK